MLKIRKHSRKKISPMHRMALEGLESRQYLSNTIYVATTGSNSNSGSQSSPLATLQAAANIAKPGTTVIVEAGTYAGFQETTSGTAAAPIVFEAQSGVTINQNNSVTADGIDLERASYVTVDGFNVTPASGVTMRSGIRSVSNTNTIISNNVITGADMWGILTGFSENVLIEGNTISNTIAQHGIYVGNSADNPEIINNISYGNNRCGIQINSDGSLSDGSLPYAQGGDGVISNALVEGNILYDNANGQGAGINFDGVVDSTIENNLIYNNQRNGIALYQVDGNEASINDNIINNTIVQNSASAIGYDAISILDGSTGAHVFNNILSAAEGTVSIDAASQSGFQEDYNVVGASGFDPTGETYGNNVTLSKWQSMGYDQHSVYVSNIDTLFVNAKAGNFQLVSGSAAIGVGNAGYAPSTDISGASRPGRGAVDAGAYQYTISSPTTPVAPNAPSSLTATAETNSQISLSWKDNSGNETGFEIFAKTGTGAFAQVGSVGAGVTAFTNTGLNAATSYTYEVIATGAAGNSGASNVITAQTQADPISAPNSASGLVATSETTSQIALSWKDNGGNETGFEILAKTGSGTFAQVGSVGAGVTTFTNTGLAANTAYTYEVIATGPGGNASASNTTTAQTQADAVSPPNAASNLTATAETTSQITLQWKDNGGNETGFKIMCKTGTGAYYQAGSVAAGVTTFTAKGLSASTAYTYAIVATGPGGNAGASNAMTVSTADIPVTTPTPPPQDPSDVPAAPVLLNVTSASNEFVILTWQESSTDVTEFKVEQLTSNGTYQTVRITDGSATQGWVWVPNSDTYTFRVVAVDDAGDSQASNTISVPGNVYLPRPRHLTTTAGSGQVNLNWNNPSLSSSATEIEVLRRTSSTAFAPIVTLSPGSSSYVDMQVTAGTQYYYRVIYLDGGLSSYKSYMSAALAS